MKKFNIEKKDSGQRVDKYLLRIMPSASKSFLYKMMRKKNIVINDKKIEGNELLSTGDIVKIWFSDETFNKFASSNKQINIDEYINTYNKLPNINILYEDDNFIILDKPVGILSQKAKDNDLSLNEWIIGYCLSNNKISSDSLSNTKPSIVNRLDRNTSGIVLAAKTVYGLNTLGTLVKNRNITKLYLTYVLGKCEGRNELSGYHLKDSSQNLVSIIDEDKWNVLSNVDKQLYTPVKTIYNSLSTIEYKGLNITKLEVDLITGKSHQIRAHLASIGHPLVGDNKYGNTDINRKIGINHQLLHAYKVIFPNDEKLGELSGKEIICQPTNHVVFEDHFSRN